MVNRTNQENSKDIYQLNEAIKALRQHAKTSNEEVGHIKKDMGDVKADIAIIKENIGWLREALNASKDALEKFDNRTWILLSSIILGTLMSIAVSYFK